MSPTTLTLSLSLFDSISTTQQIVLFALLLTTTHPIRNSLAYLAGLTGAYFACGVGGFMALDRLNEFLLRYFPDTRNLSDAGYYQFELISGLLMLFLGVWYYRKKRYATADPSQNLIVMRLQIISSTFAFFVGAIISATSFPLALPYLFALGKYSALHMHLPLASAYILLYNIGYILPMLLIMSIYLVARKRAEQINDRLHEKTRILNVQLTTWTLVSVGIFSLIDASCFFLMGHALLKGRFF